MKRRRRIAGSRFPVSDPLWYKDAVIYQLHVRAFCDSDGDGIGDFRGLRQKLDYLEDLGVNAVWLLPFYPSPLKDDGYDIADYTEVHPDYGTLQDFKAFLQAAHRRGIRVITELVVNHTSDQHPWYQRARRAKAGSSARNFYVWSDDPAKYKGARIIFKDFEPSNWTWDPVASAYYWHRFYSHQPDLNFQSPEVGKAIFKVLDFWLDLGVDGMRLDAVPYLYERENTSCENLPETHDFLKELRSHVDRKYSDRMLLAEANQWPEDAVAYFGDGDECHMAFHFPVMPRLFMAIRLEDRFPIIDILQQTPPIPETSQWALFLRNHDELTLEMVTDEDRDYMYRVYANDPRARINLGIRRRLAPLLANERKKAELMNALLFSLPGTPVIYYGDDIGMGDNIYLGDRNGVRTPMQWSGDRNAGFSRANPQKLYLPVVIDPEYHFEAVNVEAQQNNPHSFLWWLKRLIGLRKRYRAFGHGTIEFLHPENRKVLAFLRRHEDECILVLVNLSRFVQCVELDLSAVRGTVPVELFGRNPFPPVAEHPYFFTLGPHSFYWFALESPGADEAEVSEPSELTVLTVEESWQRALSGKAGAPLERALARYLEGRRWFGGKARRVHGTHVTDVVPLSGRDRKGLDACLAFVTVEYVEGEPDSYLLPLAFAADADADRVREARPHALIVRVDVKKGRDAETQRGVIYDPSGEQAFSKLLLRAIARRRRFRGTKGEIAATPTRFLRRIWRDPEPIPEPAPIRAEQSNTSVLYGDRLILKAFRRLDEGVNPDLEVGRFLTERAGFAHTPPVAGFLEYRRGRAAPVTVGILQGVVANEGDAWAYTLDSLGRYFERVLSREAGTERPEPPGTPLQCANDEPPAFVQEVVGTYLGMAALLGQRTAELHVALASDRDDPAFAPEAFPPHFQRSLYQSVRSMSRDTLDLLRKRLRDLPTPCRPDAESVLARESSIQRAMQAILRVRLDGMRIRTHGDYHLGQVLYTGKDFVIIDFEGEPARSIGERRIKRSPLRDVAGMLRSFDYASVFALRRGDGLRPEDAERLHPWAGFWSHWTSAAFLRAYLEGVSSAHLLPSDREVLGVLLDLHFVEKVLYEIRYELNNRPEWVTVPLRGLIHLLASVEDER